MSDLKDKPEQQILFDDMASNSKNNDRSILEQQIIVDDNAMFEVTSETPVIVEEHRVEKPHWLARIATVLFIIIVLVEAIEFFTLGFAQEPIIASVYGALLAVISLMAGKTFVREYLGLKQLKRRQQFQTSVNECFSDGNKQSINAKQLCQEITKQLPCDVLNELECQWNDDTIMELSDKEIIQLYSRQILSKVDQKALDKVSKFSTESVVLVALSPIAIVDMLLMFWRNFKMIDEIAHLYGLRLSYWSRIKLIKHVFVNMVYAGASELIADLGTDLLGADLLGKLSARLAQGLGAGMLTARLGLKTIEQCRPIVFEDDGPKLKDVRQKIIKQIKALASKD